MDSMTALPGAAATSLPASADPPMSKNKQKKLLRDQKWEAGREFRKAQRREKNKEKRQRKRQAAQASRKDNPPINQEGSDQLEWENTQKDSKNSSFRKFQLPVTFILDCGFDDCMMEKELKSLGCQITRSYAEAHNGPYMAHLMVSSFGARLKDRFEGLLKGHHHSWKNIRFVEEDITTAAEQAGKWMQDNKKTKLTGAFEKYARDGNTKDVLAAKGETIYLTSDSPNTLTELRPYSTYIIGGLVDKNRHKGICYKKAMEHGVQTAKLPIGDFMKMNSRPVLATNHVVEILLKWLESGDWGKAFMDAMPKRKGGTLINANKAAKKSLEADRDDLVRNGSSPQSATDDSHVEDGEVQESDGGQ